MSDDKKHWTNEEVRRAFREGRTAEIERARQAGELDHLLEEVA